MNFKAVSKQDNSFNIVRGNGQEIHIPGVMRLTLLTTHVFIVVVQSMRTFMFVLHFKFMLNPLRKVRFAPH